tara:strand:+ start:963 stop:1994 length:1032 start_codon:yes stop_codon:yes gene_type:complete
MGTLRIKRGTKTALQSSPGYVPAEGELVYTTDSKEVFVGDGATTGGTPVSVSTQNLEDLGNVQALAANNDQILVYNGTQWSATDNPAIDIRGNIYGDDSTLLVDAINGRIVGPVVTSSVTATNVVGNLTGDVVGSVTGSVVGNTTGTHFGNVVGALDGDVNGSVFGDDSTVLLDGINKTFSGNITGSTVISAATESEVQLGITSLENTSRINLKRQSATDLSGDTSVQYGTISFGRSDTGGVTTTGLIFGREDSIYFGQSASGAFGTEAVYMVWKGNKLGLGKTTPTQQLEMTGNAKIDGFVQFGSLTTTERNALTAANGMVIYNSTDNKFQGYENGSWVNLV